MPGLGGRVVADSGPDRMRAVVALPLDTVDSATTKLLWFSALLDVVVAAGVALLGNAAVRLGLRTLSQVERTAQRITDGDLNLRVPDTDPATEVGRLGQAMNTMLDRLRTPCTTPPPPNGRCADSWPTPGTNCGRPGHLVPGPFGDRVLLTSGRQLCARPGSGARPGVPRGGGVAHLAGGRRLLHRGSGDGRDHVGMWEL